MTIERSGQQGDASSRTVKQYGHNVDSVDFRGHLVSEQTELRRDGVWIPVTRVAHAWDSLPLLEGRVHFTHRWLTTTHTYRADGSIAGARFSREIWTPRQWLGTGNPIVHYELTETQEGTDLVTLAPELAARRKFQVRIGQSPYAAKDYRILQTWDETLGPDETGQLARLALTTTTYSTVAGLPIQTRVETGSAPAFTVRTFDETTGLLTSVQRPNQVALGSGKTTRIFHDAHRLFVERTLNERDHTTIERRDVATGALLRREGPNYRMVNGPYCIPGKITTCPKVAVYEPEAWSIDGLGRVLTHDVATEPADGSGYALTTIETITYEDSTLPNRRVTERLRDWTGGPMLAATIEMDGAGRVIRQIEHGAEGDAVTRYEYDAGGALHVVHTPDPRVDTGATVAHAMQRDGLGRVVEVTRPDGTSEVIVHDGLEMRSWTLSPVDGASAETRLVSDALGRLVQVDELDNPEPGDVGTTIYEYDALGRMTRMIDADGAVTELEYDLRGLRTAVSRGARTWIYAYDADGNMVGEWSPITGWLPTYDYLSSSVYDELGRLTQHTPARRGMSDTRLQQLAAGPVTYVHDAGTNGIGRLASVYHAAPSSSHTPPQWRIDYTYGLRGELRREQRSVNVTYRAPLAATQWVDRTYDATGAPSTVTWDDGTTWRYLYDDRGRVAQVQWYEPNGVGYQTVADYDRSLAGAPRARTSAFDQARGWTYDVLGRVVYDGVTRPSTAATTAERSYTYDDFGRLLGVSGQIDGRLADAVYEYDRRGRVTAGQVSTGYTGTFSYSPGGNVNTAMVTGAIDSPARNVVYEYGAYDPHAVDLLHDPSTGDIVAALDYDGAGNIVRRTLADGAHDLTWGGDDMLREATGPAGTETYYYAGGPERVLAIQPDGTVKLWFGESETHFAGGSAIRRWHHIAAGEPIARVENRTEIELQYADALQNLYLTVSSEGEVTSSFVYGPFGELVDAAGTEDHRRQFNGKESDAATGLRFYGYRYYDPLLLRWTSADPLYRFAPDTAWSEPQRANLYAFSGNNPLRYYDPDGRDWCWNVLAGDCSLDTRTVAVAKLGITALGVAAACAGTAGIGCIAAAAVGSIYGGEALHELITGEDQPHVVEDLAGPEVARHFDAGVAGASLGSMAAGWSAGARGVQKLPNGSVLPLADEAAGAAIPVIAKGTNPEMTLQAVKHTLAHKGSAEERADLFEALAHQIEKLSGGSWKATRGAAVDGGHVFLGRQGEALVVSPAGQLFRGAVSNIEFGKGGLAQIDYSKLKQLQGK